jgi:hypothetical protein
MKAMWDPWLWLALTAWAPLFAAVVTAVIR